MPSSLCYWCDDVTIQMFKLYLCQTLGYISDIVLWKDDQILKKLFQVHRQEFPEGGSTTRNSLYKTKVRL